MSSLRYLVERRERAWALWLLRCKAVYAQAWQSQPNLGFTDCRLHNVYSSEYSARNDYPLFPAGGTARHHHKRHRLFLEFRFMGIGAYCFYCQLSGAPIQADGHHPAIDNDTAAQ
jgi:hypothetical protein